MELRCRFAYCRKFPCGKIAIAIVKQIRAEQIAGQCSAVGSAVQRIPAISKIKRGEKITYS